jgi:hypothetical protein
VRIANPNFALMSMAPSPIFFARVQPRFSTDKILWNE